MSNKNLKKIDFELAKTHFLKGLDFFNNEMFVEAESSFRSSLEIIPDRESTLNNLSATLYKLKNYSESKKISKKILDINISNIEAWLNLGNALLELKQYEQALDSYDKAINIKQDYAEAWSNRGNALKELKQYEQALDSYDKAINIKPKFADALWNKSLIQLLTSDFKGGWANYEYRWLREKSDKKFHQETPSLSNLSDLQSSTILVWYEQGYGDTIQFSRYLNMLSDLGAEVIFESQESLKSLLERSFPRIKFIKRKEFVSDVDLQVPLLSLPRLFSTDLISIPTIDRYLSSDPKNLKIWKDKLNLNHSKLNIGIACSGDKNHVNDKKRSMALSHFEPLSRVANLYLVQKDLRDSDKDFLKYNPQIKFLGNQISTFDDSASIVELMDHIITVDTSLVHLSGALGKPTKVLLAWNPEWRWLLDRQDSPWYQSVKIFRQPSVGNWESVIKNLIVHLKLDR